MSQQVNKSRSELLEEIRRLQSRLSEMDNPAVSSEIKPDAYGRSQLEKNLIRAQYSIDHAIDSIFWINKEGRFEYVNESACRSLDYSRHQLLEMKVFDIDADFSEERWDGHWQEIKQKGNMLFRSRHKTRKGKVFHVEIAANFVVFDDKEYNCAFVRDISDTKRAELALYLSEQRFRAIADYTYDWELWISPGGRVLWTNPAVHRVAGFSVEECMSMYNYPMCLICDEDRDEVARVFRKSVENASSNSGLEARLKRKNGKTIWVSISWQPIYDKKGISQGYRASIRDITERRVVQEDREKLLKTLAAKNEELESIVYVSSHDLKTPLVNIQGFSGEMALNCKEIKDFISRMEGSREDKQRLESIVSYEIPESIAFINSSARKIDSLLNGLLKLSQIGRASVSVEKIDMGQLIAEVEYDMAQEIQKAGAELVFSQLPDCMADRQQIRQVFGNLIDNALKYLDDERKGQVRISGFIQNQQSVYCVQDNGIGIAEEYGEVIFEIFQRLIRKGQTPGEGLGLTIVKRIVARNNGKVWMQSEEGKGSKFYVALPKAR